MPSRLFIIVSGAPGVRSASLPDFHAERGNPGFNELLAPQLSRSGQLPQQKFL